MLLSSPTTKLQLSSSSGKSAKFQFLMEPKCKPLSSQNKYDWMLFGEDYELEINDVIYTKHKMGVSHGTLVCTNYQIRFIAYDEVPFYNGMNFVSIPLMGIDKVNKIGDKSWFFSGHTEHCFCLEFECKDMRIITFSFVPHDNSRSQTLSWLQKNILPAKRIFAHQFVDPSCAQHEIYVKYNIISEYARLGMTSQHAGPWRLCTANENYELCPTYPHHFFVPTCVTNDILFASAKFRTKGRIPVCSWRHPQTGAALCRSSQPMVGIAGKTSDNDQFLLLSIQVASLDSHPDVSPSPTESLADISQTGPPPLVIFDPRPKVNAFANTVAGAGFESATQYKNCRVRFLNIANIHVVRDSFIKMRNFCNSNILKEFVPSTLNATEWYSHLTSIFRGANRIVKKLSVGISALIHCSDGWDRTTQLISLAQLMLDPYYRTLEGFVILIEKEWLSFGHKFGDRCRTTIIKNLPNERSPIILQFLECVFHLLRSYPNAFEFNTLVLQELAKHVHFGKFGTFLLNCERERREMLEKHRSFPSFFKFLFLNQETFTNESFDNKAHYTETLMFDESDIQTWPFYPCPQIKDSWQE